MQEPDYSVPRPFVRHFDATVYKLFPDVDKKSFKVLDAAAGTGLLGLELNKLGYTYIDALADRSVQWGFLSKETVVLRR